MNILMKVAVLERGMAFSLGECRLLMVIIQDRHRYNGTKTPRNLAVEISQSEITPIGRCIASKHTVADALRYMEILDLPKNLIEDFAAVLERNGWGTEIPAKYIKQQQHLDI